jgi:hypothetical protein
MIKLKDILMEGISASSVSQVDKRVLELAKGKTYDEFLNATDGLAYQVDFLYRGGDTIELQDQSFMTDWIEHAREYGNSVGGILPNFETDLIRFDNNEFDKLRREFSSITVNQIRDIYTPYFTRPNIAFEYQDEEVPNVVGKILKSKKPFESLAKSFNTTNVLIPIMLHYVRKHNKNILSFLGTDYSDYGGQNEYVVDDVGRYVTLHDVWEYVNK